MPKAQRSQASEAMEGTTAVKQPFDFEKLNVGTVYARLSLLNQKFSILRSLLFFKFLYEANNGRQ